MSGPQPQPWPDQVTRWANNRTAAGISERSVYLYARYLTRLAAAHNLDTVTADEVTAWLAGHSWGQSARKSATSAVRMYFRWALRSGIRDDNPAELIDPVKTPKARPKPVPETLLTGILGQADCDPDIRLMVMLAAYAGLRRNEIATLHSDHIVDDLLHVTGKGGRTRIVPIHADLVDRLTHRPPGWIFPGRFPGTHASADYVGKRLSRLLGPGWTGHKLRSRYANRVYNVSRDLFALQELLGHASPETTRRYVLTDLDDLRAAAAAAL